jgi:hypothetical protein
MPGAIPTPITPPHQASTTTTKQQQQQQQNNNNNNNNNLQHQHHLSIYKTSSSNSLHRQEQQYLQNVAVKVGATFFVPPLLLSKGHWLRHLELQQQLRISKGFGVFSSRRVL